MHPDIKLVVPEINGDILTENDLIIANPNCSTIQMVMALAPLHTKFKIKRIVVSTYQSVTGTGAKALQQLEDESAGNPAGMVYHYPIYRNVIPHCDVFLENGYTKEEMKMVNETRKILRDNNIQVTATTVRVPVKGGHSEAVNVEFENEFSMEEVYRLLNSASGVVVLDDVTANKYPMPLFAEGKDDVFVGRIRRDESQAKSLNLWIVADNLRKGAATNAIQIAEFLNKKGMPAVSMLNQPSQR
jgi:aspartate-semialdehyde dehydrogenase